MLCYCHILGLVTYNPRTDSHRIFKPIVKLGGSCDPPCTTTYQGQKVKGQGRKVAQRISIENATSRLISSRFCACAVKISLKIALNAAKLPKFKAILGNRGRQK